MPFDPTTAQPIAFDPTTAVPVQPQQAGMVNAAAPTPNTLMDMARSFGTHFTNAMAPVVKGSEAAFALVDPLTHADTAVKLANAPSLKYQSQTPEGQYAGSVGDYAPAALFSPGSAATRIGAAIGGGLGAQYGKERFGPYGQLVGGVLGGGVGGASGSRIANLVGGSQAPTSAALTSAQKFGQATDSYSAAFANHGGTPLPSDSVNLPDQVRNVFANDPQVAANIDNPQIGMALPKTKIAFDALQDAVTMPNGRLANLEFARRAAKDAAVEGSGTDQHFGGVLRKTIDNYMNSMEGNDDLLAARAAFRSASKAEPLEDLVAAANLDSQRNGSDLGKNIASRFASFASPLKNNMSNYSDEEQALIKQVATGSNWSQKLSKLGAIIKSPPVRLAAGAGGMAVGGFGGAYTGYQGAQGVGQMLQNFAPVGAPERAQTAIQTILGQPSEVLTNNRNAALARILLRAAPIAGGAYAAQGAQ